MSANPRALKARHHAVNLLTQLLAIRIPPTIDTLTNILDHQLDGYPPTASGADTGPRGHPELTATENVANHRLGDLEDRLIRGKQVYHPGPANVLYDLDELLGIIHRAATDILELCDQHGPTTQHTIPLCDGRGLEGFDRWGTACTLPATKAGLCNRHYMAAWRWRRNHGLRPLTQPGDEVA